MAFFPKPTARGVLVACVWLTVFWRTDPATPEMIERAPVPVPNAVIDLSAVEIFARMAAVYSGCRSYQDHGVSWTEFDGGFSNHVSHKPFETHFVRGGGFRFEYSAEGTGSLLSRMLRGDKRMVVWGDERRAQTWWTVSGLSSGALSMELAGATGVSGGTAHTVPRMLLPDLITGSCLVQTTDAVVVGIENVDGRACYRIDGKYGSRPQSIWVDTETYLLLRTRDTYVQSGETRVTSTIAYAPRLNVAIDPAVFAFEPPE